MKSIFTILTLLSITFASVPSTHLEPYLDPSVPIHLGEIFWPPSLTLIAWLPTTMINELDFCMKATQVGERLFSLSGVDALQIRDYFKDHAYLTREGKRFAECYVTPESVLMGSCQGMEDRVCEGGHKYTGPGRRKWTCWINASQWGRNVTDEERKPKAVGGALTDAEYTPTSVMNGGETGSVVLGAFTPGVTGR